MFRQPSRPNTSLVRMISRHWPVLLMISAAHFSVFSVPQSAMPAQPTVVFDASYMISCRDVTPKDFSQINPKEKLLEAKFQVSSLFPRGGEKDISQFLYHIENPHKCLKIVDYIPRTTLSTDVVGNFGVETSKERARSLEIGLSGTYDHFVNADASGSTNNKSTSSVRYEQLPHMELLAASGTMYRGTGAYFKLKPSKRTSLEGAKEFGLVLRVPKSWRGDYVRMVCEATAENDRLVSALEDDTYVCSRDYFVVALHAEGDEPSRRTAEALIRAELDFRQLSTAWKSELEKRSFHRFKHKFGRLLGVANPRIPNGWMETLIVSPTGRELGAYADHLPVEVRQAAEDYLDAKRRMTKLNGRAVDSSLDLG